MCRIFATLLIAICMILECRAFETDSKKPGVHMRVALSEWNSPIDLDFGDVLAGSSLKGEVTLVNDTGIDLTSTRIHKSCGCLNEVPNVISLKSGESLAFPINFLAPNQFAVLAIKLTLESTSDNPKDRSIVIRGRSRLHFELDKTRLRVLEKTDKAYSIVLSKSAVSEISKSFDVNVRGEPLQKIGFFANTNELTVRVDVSKVPDGTTSETCFLDIVVDGTVIESHALDVVVADRCTIRPSVLFLDREGKMQTPHATFIMRGALPDNLQLDNIRSSIVDGESEYDVVTIRKFVRNNFVATVQIELRSDALMASRLSNACLLKFCSSDSESKWSVSVPLRIAN